MNLDQIKKKYDGQDITVQIEFQGELFVDGRLIVAGKEGYSYALQGITVNTSQTIEAQGENAMYSITFMAEDETPHRYLVSEGEPRLIGELIDECLR